MIHTITSKDVTSENGYIIIENTDNLLRFFRIDGKIRTFSYPEIKDMSKVRKSLINGMKWNLTPKEYKSLLEGSNICLCESSIEKDGECLNCKKRI